MLTAAMAGDAIGTITFWYIVNTVPPSIYIDSSSSLGILSINPFIKNVEKGVTHAV